MAKLTHDQAEVWKYRPSKQDDHFNAQFLGWSHRPKSYLHQNCNGYFTKMEKHDCVHWTKSHLKTIKRWTKGVQADLKAKAAHIKSHKRKIGY